MTDDQTADECGICLETLNTAVTLPCNHKFCAACLDGWKSKFVTPSEKEKSKSCPLCRKKIPPSKEMLIELEYHRTEILKLEGKGDTTSTEQYILHAGKFELLEAEIGDYEGEGIDYDEGCIDLPKHVYEGMLNKNIKRLLKWLGSPVDKTRLSARYPDYLNYTLVHLAIHTDNSDLLSILLQYGADVNALDAKGFAPLMIATKFSLEQAKILLEWGAEISLPRNLTQQITRKNESDKDAFIRMAIQIFGENKLTKLISSEFGGRRCEVINLPNHPQLNGKTCVVEKYITKKDKYKIIFEGLGNAALVGPNNLKRRDRTTLDCGYYISFKNGRVSRREFATKEECQAYVTSLGGGDVKETAEELSSLEL